jgi:ribosomal-protein-alanine N-acetyltransferase
VEALEQDDLRLEPLRAAHAEDLYPILVDPALYTWLDEEPPVSIDKLRARYAYLESRRSPDGREHWLNWAIEADGCPAGTAQATVLEDGRVWVAYVLGTAFQGRVLATRATQLVIDHIASAYGARLLLATVEADNRPSIALLERLGFRAATDEEASRYSLTLNERLYRREAGKSCGAPSTGSGTR